MHLQIEAQGAAFSKDSRWEMLRRAGSEGAVGLAGRPWARVVGVLKEKKSIQNVALANP